MSRRLRRSNHKHVLVAGGDDLARCGDRRPLPWQIAKNDREITCPKCSALVFAEKLRGADAALTAIDLKTYQPPGRPYTPSNYFRTAYTATVAGKVYGYVLVQHGFGTRWNFHLSLAAGFDELTNNPLGDTFASKDEALWRIVEAVRAGRLLDEPTRLAAEQAEEARIRARMRAAEARRAAELAEGREQATLARAALDAVLRGEGLTVAGIKAAREIVAEHLTTFKGIDQ